MKIKFSILIVLLTLLLASCSNSLQILPRADLNLSLSTGGESGMSQIMEDVEIDTEKGTVTFSTRASIITASAKSGSLGVDISSFTADYFYADGTQIETSTGASYRGNIGLHVPAGVLCPKPKEGDEALACTINTSGAVAAPGPSVSSIGVNFLPWDIVGKLWNESDGISRPGAYAIISVEGTDSNGNHFSKQMEPATIVFSVTSK